MDPGARGRDRRARARVFGGMVADDAGFIRKKMARNIPPGLRDRRDWQQIEAWAQGQDDERPCLPHDVGFRSLDVKTLGRIRAGSDRRGPPVARARGSGERELA